MQGHELASTVLYSQPDRRDGLQRRYVETPQQAVDHFQMLLDMELLTQLIAGRVEGVVAAHGFTSGTLDPRADTQRDHGQVHFRQKAEQSADERQHGEYEQGDDDQGHVDRQKGADE